MVDAGVQIHQDCLDCYEQFKMKNKYDFVIYKLNAKMTVLEPFQCIARGESEKAWEEHKDSSAVKREKDEPVEYWNLRRLLVDNKSPCFATILIPVKAAQHPILIYWCPSDVGGRSPMVYSSTVLKFKGRLQGLKGSSQCNDMDEVSFSEVFKSYN